MNVKRPKRLNEEDEDDLMQFQNEFLKLNQQPSAKVVKKQELNEDRIKEELIGDSRKLTTSNLRVINENLVYKLTLNSF